MRNFLCFPVIVLCYLLTTQAQANSATIKYSVTTVKKIGQVRLSKDVTIQQVKLESAEELNKKTIERINLQLAGALKEFANNSEECRVGAQGHPWEFRSKIEKVLRSTKYISFVFSRSTVCGGSPDFERDPIVFSSKTGDRIFATNLFKEVFPEKELKKRIFPSNNLIKLNADMIEALIKDTKTEISDYNEECDYYLKNTSYRIWVENGKMVFFPEFTQSESDCQKEYFIKIQP